MGGELRCCIASAFQPTVCTLRWFSSTTSRCQSSTALVVRSEQEQEQQEALSVFATGALPQSSPLLRWEFVDRGAPHAGTSGRDAAGKVSDDTCVAGSWAFHCFAGRRECILDAAARILEPAQQLHAAGQEQCGHLH